MVALSFCLGSHEVMGLPQLACSVALRFPEEATSAKPSLIPPVDREVTLAVLPSEDWEALSSASLRFLCAFSAAVSARPPLDLLPLVA